MPRSLRMFPYKDASGKVDLPHLRNAIARIPQSNRIDAATKKRLQSRARRLLGSSKSMSLSERMQRIHEAVRKAGPQDGSDYYNPRDVYDDHVIVETHDGEFKAHYMMNMTTGEVALSPRVEWKPVKHEWVDKSFVRLYKDAKGQWWFLGIYSNKFQDRDKEIISEAAHKEYVAWLKETGFRPVVTVYHQPRMPDTFWPSVFRKHEKNPKALQKVVDKVYEQTGFAKTEFIAYLNGFTVVLAKVLPGKEKIAARLSKLKGMAMSHGFIVKKISANIIDVYRSFELSVLKREHAANLLTKAGLTQEGIYMAKQKGISSDQRAELVRLLGEDGLAELMRSTKNWEQVGESVLEYKQALDGDEPKDDESSEDEESPEDDVEYEEEDGEVVLAGGSEIDAFEDYASHSIATWAKRVTEAFSAVQADIKSLREELAALQTENVELKKAQTANAKMIKHLRRKDDDRVERLYRPLYDKTVGYSASQDEDETVTEDEKKTIKKGTPGKTKTEVAKDPLYMGVGSLFGGQG